MQIKAYQSTILYTILHFVVDGICAASVFSYLYSDAYEQCLIVFLIYNFLAFLSQPFVGYFIDRWNRPKLFLVISIVFLSLGYLFHFQFILASICLGIGNSIFHVCGGKDVTTSTKNDIVSLGVFVSTGAIGLMLGQRFFSEALLISFYSILFVVGLILLLVKKKGKKKDVTFSSSRVQPIRILVFLLALLSFVVAIRSFVGKIVILDFEASIWVFAAIAVATALGKMAGGIAAKYLGINKTIIISMVFAIPCLCIWNTNPYTILLGIFMFNFSMPITLYYANHISKGKEGFAFGLLAAALIPGYLLGMLSYSPLVVNILITVLSVGSVCIVYGVGRSVRAYGAF